MDVLSQPSHTHNPEHHRSLFSSPKPTRSRPGNLPQECGIEMLRDYKICGFPNISGITRGGF